MKRKRNLILFFTLGISLEKWNKVGMIEREIAPYNIMADKFNKIYFFTYGDKKDLKYKKLLKDNIEIIYNRYNINKYLYSILMPFLNIRLILSSATLKSNQIIGAWSALISKILKPSNKLILRAGYTPSLLEKGINGKSLKYRFFMLLEFILYNLCDKAIVTSYESLEYVIIKYKININNIVKIPNYIDTDIFRPIKRKKNGRILFIGRITKIKNLKNLIKALEGTHIGLDIIGEGDSDFKSELIALIQKLQVDIRLIGSIHNHTLPWYINKYSIFILPSLREGMPKTLLEAMACGIPCIGTDVPGINEVITEGYNGLLSSSCKSKDLYNTINRLIYNKKLKKKLSNNARYTILNFYSLKRLIGKEIDLHENLYN